MRVVVAGATGVLGRPLLDRLRARGHQVTAMVGTATAPAARWLPALCERLGGPPARTVPAPMAARLIGWFPAFQLTEMRGAADDRARAELGWKPARPNWRTGLGAG